MSSHVLRWSFPLLCAACAGPTLELDAAIGLDAQAQLDAGIDATLREDGAQDAGSAIDARMEDAGSDAAVLVIDASSPLEDAGSFEDARVLEEDAGCPSDRTLCGTECVSLLTDSDHCGSCDNALPFYLRCEGGGPVCAIAGATLCDGRCVDLLTDGQNCGRCDNPIPDREVGMVCRGGMIVCDDPAATRCPGTGCFDLSRDAFNCGTCGRRIPLHSRCVDGRFACDSGYTLCGDLCVDVTADPAHCGACDRSCPVSGSTCAAPLCRFTSSSSVPARCSTLCAASGAVCTSGFGTYVESVVHTRIVSVACDTMAPASVIGPDGFTYRLDTLYCSCEADAS